MNKFTIIIATMFTIMFTNVASATVTFDDVKPILAANCNSCHPGASSYVVAYGMKDKIYQLFVVEKEMPPKHRFQPTAQDRATVKAWIESGAKR